MPEQDDSFFIRWSRRKSVAGQAPPRKATDEQPDLAGVADDGHGDDASGEVGTGGRSDAPSPATRQNSSGTAAAEQNTVPEDLAGVDIDALSYESDFTRFMQNDVPEALRKRALQQLWRSDPILANVDGLNDYDDDFTDAALAVKVLQTAHKVGRGYLDDDEEAAAVEADPGEKPSAAEATEGNSDIKADGADAAGTGKLEAAGDPVTATTVTASGEETPDATAALDKSNT